MTPEEETLARYTVMPIRALPAVDLTTVEVSPFSCRHLGCIPYRDVIRMVKDDYKGIYHPEVGSRYSEYYRTAIENFRRFFHLASVARSTVAYLIHLWWQSSKCVSIPQSNHCCVWLTASSLLPTFRDRLVAGQKS